MQLPSVSKSKRHPFYITSCPYDPYVSVHIRLIGDFTRALGDAVGVSPHKPDEGPDLIDNYEAALQNGQQMPVLRIDGPYGNLADVVYKNDIAVLVGCGIGLAPWVSILKNIWHLRHAPKLPDRLRHVELMWICRDTRALEWFRSLISTLESGINELTPSLRIHIYVAQKMDVDATANILLNSIGSEVDSITGLMSKTNFGRPNFTKLFTSIGHGILDGAYPNGPKAGMRTTVGVYLGGPSGVGKYKVHSLHTQR